MPNAEATICPLCLIYVAKLYTQGGFQKYREFKHFVRNGSQQGWRHGQGNRI